MAPFKDNKKPPLDYRAILRDLKADGPQNLYLLWGEEDYLLREFVRQIQTMCLEGGAGDFDARRLDGPIPDVREVEDALDAMPFFGGRTYLELRDADVNKWKDERLQKALLDVPEWCTVVIVLPVGESPDGRLGFIKALREKGRAIEFNSPDMGLIYNWIRRRVESHGKKIGQAAMDQLVFISGDKMTGLIPEIEKICAHASGDTVTAEDVEAVAHHIPEAKSFALTDCISQGDMDGAAAILTELLAGDSEPVAIQGAIAAQIRRLYAAKVAEERDLGIAFLKDALGIRSDFVIRKHVNLARRFSRRALANDVRLCAESLMWTRERGSVMDETDALKELLIRFSLEGKNA